MKSFVVLSVLCACAFAAPSPPAAVSLIESPPAQHQIISAAPQLIASSPLISSAQLLSAHGSPLIASARLINGQQLISSSPLLASGHQLISSSSLIAPGQQLISSSPLIAGGPLGSPILARIAGEAPASTVHAAHVNQLVLQQPQLIAQPQLLAQPQILQYSSLPAAPAHQVLLQSPLVSPRVTL